MPLEKRSINPWVAGLAIPEVGCYHENREINCTPNALSTKTWAFPKLFQWPPVLNHSPLLCHLWAISIVLPVLPVTPTDLCFPSLGLPHQHFRNRSVGPEISSQAFLCQCFFPWVPLVRSDTLSHTGIKWTWYPFILERYCTIKIILLYWSYKT